LSIEAARAGDTGSGFAVVAAEVRTLAQRTATSAREINHLIKDAMAKVEYGSTQVNRSGETLHQIVDAVKGVAAVVSEISSACSEQALAIDNVNSAVTSVDMVTQLNATQSEELSSTAKQLLSNSAELEAMVSSFRIGGGGNGRLPPRRSRCGPLFTESWSPARQGEAKLSIVDFRQQPYVLQPPANVWKLHRRFAW
jgi:methyl-accepting chemotaxis protein